ncbi:hypothetical protein SAMN02745704_01853 [Paucidesulfovibrio gracilis DSM 16080]|uniref:Uncharacterized protein n=1 Tax=Paucidesulfovibrio gracilis DSM 16080 TaxID=1121449 RepID=A0A1T4X8D3_9BACT|nr:hypothetical protein [Paucidesulfovibrio gracilis]SKA85368.1 hypothetical protein SAMN02745704_01853 [Paucidesulfovibrio gracilis DSM 16080]
MQGNHRFLQTMGYGIATLLLALLWSGMGHARSSSGVDVEFFGMPGTLREHNVNEKGLPQFMATLSRHRDLLQNAHVLVTEQKRIDATGFRSATGKASFVITLALTNDVVLKTRENICPWSNLDRCLNRSADHAMRTYRQMQRKHGVNPGSTLMNL